MPYPHFGAQLARKLVDFAATARPRSLQSHADTLNRPQQVSNLVVAIRDRHGGSFPV